jgi:hypothetical protein
MPSRFWFLIEIGTDERASEINKLSGVRMVRDAIKVYTTLTRAAFVLAIGLKLTHWSIQCQIKMGRRAIAKGLVTLPSNLR